MAIMDFLNMLGRSGTPGTPSPMGTYSATPGQSTFAQPPIAPVSAPSQPFQWPADLGQGFFQQSPVQASPGLQQTPFGLIGRGIGSAVQQGLGALTGLFSQPAAQPAAQSPAAAQPAAPPPAPPQPGRMGGGGGGGIQYQMPNFGMGMVTQGFNQMGNLGQALGSAFAGVNQLNAGMAQANKDRDLEMYLANLQSQTAQNLAPWEALGGAGGPLATGLAGEYATQQTGINADLQRYLGQLQQTGETARQGTFDQQAGLAGALQQMGIGGNVQLANIGAGRDRDVAGMNALAGLLGGGTFDQQANLAGGLAALDANRQLAQTGTFGEQSDLQRYLANLGSRTQLAQQGTFGEQAGLAGGLAALDANRQLAQSGTFGQQANLAERLGQLGRGADLELQRMQSGTAETIARLNAQRDLAQGGTFDQNAALQQNLAGMQYGSGLEGLQMQNTAAQRLAELGAQRDLLTQGTFGQQSDLARALTGMTEGGRTTRAGLLADTLGGIFQNIPQINLPPINTGPGPNGPYGEGASLMPPRFPQQQMPFQGGGRAQAIGPGGQPLMAPGLRGMAPPPPARPPAPPMVGPPGGSGAVGQGASIPDLRTTPPPPQQSFYQPPGNQRIPSVNVQNLLRTQGPESVPGSPYYRPGPVGPLPPSPPPFANPFQGNASTGADLNNLLSIPQDGGGRPGMNMPTYGQGGRNLGEIIGRFGGGPNAGQNPAPPPAMFANPYQGGGGPPPDLAAMLGGAVNRNAPPPSMPGRPGRPGPQGLNPMTGLPIAPPPSFMPAPAPPPAQRSISRAPVRGRSTGTQSNSLMRMLSGLSL